MAASRAARKREMIANLCNEEYLNDLVSESYAIIFTQSTTNTVAQKKVKKAFEAGGCHIGTKDKHASWKAGNGDFQTVDAFLESDNSAGTVRDQLALYTLFLMFDTRIRHEVSATERERDTWTDYREEVPMVDELDVSECVVMLTAKVQSVHAARQPAAPGAGQAAERNMNVRVHVPKLESMPSSATDGNPAGQYTHLLQLQNSSEEDKTPDALRAALSKDIHERLLTDFNLFERNRGDLTAVAWAALSKAEVVEKWLTRTISNFDVSDLAQKEIAKLRAYKQGTMTTEIYFQELHSLITSTEAYETIM